MSGLSFGLGSKRPAPRGAAPAKAKKPLTVNDVFSPDSSDDEAEQPSAGRQQPARPAPQQDQPQKRSRWDAPVGAAVAPPSDPEVRKAADKLAEFVAKHGRSFEDITKQRNPGDTVFKFLFNPSCADYKYYESKVKELSAAPAPPPAPTPPQPPRHLPPPPPVHAAPSSSSQRPYASGSSSSSSGSRFGSSSQGPFHNPEEHDEPVEKHIAKNALAAGDTVAAMNAYAALVAKRARGGEEEEEEEAEVNRSQPLANDTAFERRKVTAVYKEDGSRGHHMQDFIPPEEMAKFMGACGDEAAKRAAQSLQQKHALKEDNIGHKLLQKMGWREGEGIGGTQKGITAPVAASGIKQDNLGLGAAPVHEVSQEDDIFEQYRKRMMLGYKYRPNPLGNPRKPYY